MKASQQKTGVVYLVGAGPGDAGLITVRGAECLAQADVVVYDHLANEALLDGIPAHAERVYVGKTASAHTMTQAEINSLLVTKAREGRTVVRLKGGDPFVFGRGGEEAIELCKSRVPFEVVPGVSAAIGVPAYAGIPVTHRSMSASLHVITGHEDPGKDSPQIEWDVLAKTEGTLVFMMGVGNLQQIVRELVSRGRSPETPVALVRWGTLPEQETLVSTLGKVVEEVRRIGFTPPAVTVVGPVVELRPLLQWYEAKPLFGVRAAVTRPAGQNRSLVDLLRRAGADVVACPTIRIEPREMTPATRREIDAIASYDWVVFTSTNGVSIFFDHLMSAGMDARSLATARIAAIGEKTAGSLRARGICPDAVPKEYVQEELARCMHMDKGSRVLIARAAEARVTLEEDLQRRGAKVKILPLYDTVPDKPGTAALRQHLTRGRVHLATFTSSSTVECFLKAVKKEDVPKLFADVVAASIGPVTSATLRAHGVEPQIEAATSTAEGLAEAIVAWYARRTRGGPAHDTSDPRFRTAEFKGRKARRETAS